jgi:GNAT superfamily N-acetyltransferase
MGTSHPAPEPPVPASHEPPFRWIPIRSLSTRHRPKILAHLLSLEESDRYLRFGYHASDAQVGLYVDRLDFDHDEVFGIFNRKLELIAMAHLAVQAPRDGRHVAEFGVSVMKKARGRGYGSRLFDHAVLHARNRQVDTLVINALSENLAMLRIAHNAGSTIEREGGDAEARLRLPPDNLGTLVDQLLQSQAAEWDYQLKQGARRFDALLDIFSDVRALIGDVRGKRIE